MSKIKWKEIYEKCNHNKYSQVTNIYREYSIKSNVKNLMSNYGIIILDTILLSLAFLLYIFRNNLIIVLYFAILCFLMFLMLMFYNTYKISLKKDKLVARVNLQDNIVPYDKLNTIYLSREKVRMFFIPVYTYTLKITYYIDKETINILSFPVIMLNKQEVINFFKSFDIKTYEIKDEKKKA